MRIIDANALIGELHNCSFYDGGDRTLVYAVIETQPTIEPQKWIPVSERLPEEKGEYLVTYHPCYWDNVQQDIKVGIDSFRGKTSWAKKKHQRVTAWMPLPEPWKGENNEVE